MDGTDPETAEKIQIENLSKTYTLQFYATHKLLTPTQYHHLSLFFRNGNTRLHNLIILSHPKNKVETDALHINGH